MYTIGSCMHCKVGGSCIQGKGGGSCIQEKGEDHENRTKDLIYIDNFLDFGRLIV
jgi:hypothetical protein